MPDAATPQDRQLRGEFATMHRHLARDLGRRLRRHAGMARPTTVPVA